MARFCQNCGSQVPDESNFCQNCGNRVAASAQQTNYNQNMNQGMPQYNQNMNQGNMQAPKSKITAGLLGLFLGAWGIHNFYLGNTSRAVIQIVVTICTCGIGSLWGFIEGIMILCGSINTDANGNPLSD